jgi:hypothetical protein
VSSRDHDGGIRTHRARVSIIESDYARHMQLWALRNFETKTAEFRRSPRQPDIVQIRASTWAMVKIPRFCVT